MLRWCYMAIKCYWKDVNKSVHLAPVCCGCIKRLSWKLKIILIAFLWTAYGIFFLFSSHSDPTDVYNCEYSINCICTHTCAMLCYVAHWQFDPRYPYPLEWLYWPQGYHDHTHDDVIKWKHFPRYWTFVRGIHRSPVNSPHKSQWRGALMFSLICTRISGWVNNREAGDLRRHRAHYDVTIMYCPSASEATLENMIWENSSHESSMNYNDTKTKQSTM